MKVIVVENYDEMSQKGAEILAGKVKENPALNLGLATGSTPVGMYEILGKMYQAGELDFSQAHSYNLDEYQGLDPENEQSYHYFMKKNFFSKVNLDEKNIHFPYLSDKEGDHPYDQEIAEAGGIDIQVLGIGNDGHIAFNEPEEKLWVYTHETGLTESTIQANSRFFSSIEEVPSSAITLGIGSIMKAKTLLIMANGENKQEAVKALIGGERIFTSCPVTLTLAHPDAYLIVDKAALGQA